AEGGATGEIDARGALTKAPQALGQGGAGEGPDEGERDRASPRAAKGAHRLDAVAHRGEQGLRVRQESATSLGQGRPAPGPLEQRRAQLPLEQADAATDRGLGQMEDWRGPGEPPEPDDGHERLDVVQL